jgi:hypothetical protein
VRVSLAPNLGPICVRHLSHPTTGCSGSVLCQSRSMETRLTTAVYAA